MEIQEYKPNSHKYKKQQQEAAKGEKKIQKVISGNAKVKPKSELRKFTDVFISVDAANVKSYILSDVLVPAIKKLVSDIVKDGIEMILYGGTGRSGRSSRDSRVSYVSYDRFSGGRDDRRIADSRTRTRFDYGDILFESRGEAEAVRDQMDEVIAQYGFVTVADMYDMAELTAPFTANKFGWSSVRSAEIVRQRDGYVIKLPKASPID